MAKRKPPRPDSPEKFVGAVEAAAAILRHLANHRTPVGVAAIARSTELHVSTTFNILRTLCKEELVAVDADTKTYRIGYGILELSAPLLGSNQIDLVRPVLERLSAEHRILIGLWQVTPDERIVLLDRVVARGVVRVDIALGSRLPAFVGAIGRCYAATLNLPKNELREKFRTLRWDRAPDFAHYAADVGEAKQKGFARDFGNLFASLDIVAAVVTDHEGMARFGISGIAIAAQHSHAELETVGAAIGEAAKRLSLRLYGRDAHDAADHVEPPPATPRVPRSQPAATPPPNKTSKQRKRSPA